MTEKYVVEVAAPLEGESDAVANQLARILKLDLARVASLISRLPDVVTRPVSHREATVVVERFTQAGLQAHIRPAESAVRAAPAVKQVTRESATAAGVFPAEVAGPVLHEGTHFDDTDLGGGPGSSAAFDNAFDEPILVTDVRPEPLLDSGNAAHEPALSAPIRREPAADAAARPASIPAASRVQQPGDISPADLQARLQRTAQTSSIRTPDKAAAAEGTHRSSSASGTAVMEAAGPNAAAAPSPTIVAAAPATPGEAAAQRAARTRGGTPRRGSLQAKLVSLAVIPVLLTIIGALAATWYTARPALYQQRLDSARNPAIATAASLSSAFEQVAGDSATATGGIDYLQLQSTILITRQAFPREDIAFIIATDTNGDPLPGFFAGAQSLATGTVELQTAIRDRALAAIAAGPSARTGRQDQTSQLLTSGNTNVEIVAQPLIVNNMPVGAIVVGVTDLAVTTQVNRILVNVLLFSLVPLLLAILIAVVRARRLTGSVLLLTEKADQISRGNLDERIEVRSNDELDDLSEALERMRVSMKGALERLRRRR
jgi:HAMP domain-containing protein